MPTSSHPVPGGTRSPASKASNGDVVDLRGFGLANLPALGPYISQVGADTLFVLNSGDILTLKNINSGTLVDNDFQFV